MNGMTVSFSQNCMCSVQQEVGAHLIKRDHEFDVCTLSRTALIISPQSNFKHKKILVFLLGRSLQISGKACVLASRWCVLSPSYPYLTCALVRRRGQISMRSASTPNVIETRMCQKPTFALWSSVPAAILARMPAQPNVSSLWSHLSTAMIFKQK